MGVEWVTGPGRRIVRRTVLTDVSRMFGVRPGLGTHSHADQSIHRSGGSLSARLNPRCRVGRPVQSRKVGGASVELHLHESARPTNSRGSGAFLSCTPRTHCSGKWLPVGASLPLPSQRSYFELLAVRLPGPTGISPSQSSSIRSQDGPSFTHSISASFRNPLGSRTISMRSVHRDLKSPTAQPEPVRRRWLRSLPQH